MKRIFMLLSVFVLATLAMSAQPKLLIENGDEYNWGNVKPTDSPLKAKVKIFNKGNTELNITNVRPGCGCTTAPLDKSKIAPGDFATLDITLNVGSNTGSVTKSILIESNDPSRQSFHYYIKAVVVRPLDVNPQYLVFNELYLGREAVSKATIKNTTDKDITITDVEVMPATLKINVKANTVIPAKSEITLESTYTAAIEGTNHLKVTLKTNHPDAPSIEITGWGNAVSNPNGISIEQKKK